MQQGEAVADRTPGAVEAAPVPLAAEELAKRAAAARHVSAMLGDAVALLIRSPHYKHYALTDLEWLREPDRSSSALFARIENVNQTPKHSSPPLALGQCFIATAQDKTTGFAAPIGMLLWATVSEDVNRRLTENVGQPIRLRPDEWKSGEIAWLVAAEGDPLVVLRMVSRVREADFRGKAFEATVYSGDDSRKVVVLHSPGSVL